MIKVNQRFKFDPENFTFDDSLSAIFASIFEVPIEHVPHFFSDGVFGNEARIRINSYLHVYGLRLASIPMMDYEGEGIQPILDQMQSFSPDVMYILTGMPADKGPQHSVLVCGDQILHDPDPDSGGFFGPCVDGHYWVEFLVDSRTVRR